MKLIREVKWRRFGNMDVTGKLQLFVSPFKNGTYSRNVWDMQLFNGKIYIGQGNASNAGIDQNAGPVPITSFDPVTATFATELIADEEQIDTFKILNGKLTAPGLDSRESWELGNYYTLEPTGWSKHRTITRGIHVFDMEYFNGIYFAGLGSDSKKSPIVYSEDDGKTWIQGTTPVIDFVRVYNVFEFQGSVYAAEALHNAKNAIGYGMGELKKFNGTTFEVMLGQGLTLFPGMPLFPPRNWGFFKMTRVTKFADKLMYIANICNNDQQSLPIALCVSSKIGMVSAKVSFPEIKALPMDILVRGNKAYALTYLQTPNGFTTIVYESTDLSLWKEVIRFTDIAFARSFEELNGVFYFGMGCHIYPEATPPVLGPIPSSVGSILRCRYVCDSAAYCGFKL